MKVCEGLFLMEEGAPIYESMKPYAAEYDAKLALAIVQTVYNSTEGHER